jgi:arylsulfatase A-like enzyme
MLACFRPAPSPSNVLILSIDTLRADHVSAYGYARDTTPFLVSLATEATIFDNAYSQSNFTLVSHVSLLTSLFPPTHGVTKDVALAATVPLLAETLQRAGYRTAGFYGASWLSAEFGLQRGFERYDFHENGTDALAAVLPFLREAAADARPFFAFVHLFDVHAGSLDKRGAPLYDAPLLFRERFVPHPEVEPAPYLARDIWEGRVDLTPAQAANLIARYDGGVRYVDELLRQIVDTLGASDVLDETLVIITADHGESLGDRGRYSNHGFLYEEGLRVPLLVKLPITHPAAARHRGSRIDRRVQLVDVAPTVLRAVGVAIPHTYQGSDLFAPESRDIMAFRGASRMLIRDDYKLATSNGAKGRELLQIQEDGGVALYHLPSDPGETRPLQEQQPELAAAMQAALERHHDRQLDQRKRLDWPDGRVGVELSEEEIGRLQALGYLQDDL